MLHFNVAQVLCSAENESANVSKRVWVAYNFIDNELAHDKETRGTKRLGLANNRFGHFLVDPGAKTAEQVLRRMLVVTVNHIKAFFKFIDKLECFAGGSLTVVIEADNVVAGGLCVACHECAVLPKVFGEADSLDVVVAVGECLDDLPDVVGAAVVD